MRVKNVSDGIRYGWREHDPKRIKIEAEITSLEAMEPKDIGERIAKREELHVLRSALQAVPIKIVMTLPDEIHEVPVSSQAAFLKHLTDDWAMVDAAGANIPWPPGQHVRRTVKVTPRGRESDNMQEHRRNLAEVGPDGTRYDPRAVAARQANAG